MKKIIILCTTIIIIIVCFSVITFGAETSSVGTKNLLSVSTSGTVVDSDLVDSSAQDVEASLLQQTYVKYMFFIGESKGWKANYIVSKLANSNEIKAKLVLSSKTKFSDGIWVHIKTTQGTYSKSGKVTDNGLAVFDDNLPIALKDEVVKVTVVYGSEMDTILLSNKYPEDVISPEEAFISALTEYKIVYNEYPNEEYTFIIDYEEDGWVVSYDDNDNIGGKGYIIVDSVTGEAGDIKVEE